MAHNSVFCIQIKTLLGTRLYPVIGVLRDLWRPGKQRQVSHCVQLPPIFNHTWSFENAQKLDGTFALSDHRLVAFCWCCVEHPLLSELFLF